jgi:hypothetical protein
VYSIRGIQQTESYGAKEQEPLPDYPPYAQLLALCLEILQLFLEACNEIGSALSRFRLSLIHLAPDAVAHEPVACHECVGPVVVFLVSELVVFAV